jgi:hypothetical protein
MKIIKFFIIAIVAIVAISCNEEPSRSPYIQPFYVRINSDTITNNSKLEVPVGDTLKLSLSLYGFYHDLEYFSIKMDREYAKDTIAHQEDLLTYCNPLYTNVKEGVYSFKPGVQNMNLTLYLIPKRAKEDTTQPIPVSLSLKSACKTSVEYNPFYMDFNYYITNKK